MYRRVKRENKKSTVRVRREKNKAVAEKFIQSVVSVKF